MENQRYLAELARDADDYSDWLEVLHHSIPYESDPGQLMDWASGSEGEDFFDRALRDEE